MDMLDDQVLSDVVEIANIARSRKLFAEAECMFQLLARAYPERAFSQVGLGLLALDQNCNSRACAYFEEARRRAPDEIDIAAWHGVALICAQRKSEARSVLLNVCAMDSPEKTPGQKMAEDLLSSQAT